MNRTRSKLQLIRSSIFFLVILQQYVTFGYTISPMSEIIKFSQNKLCRAIILVSSSVQLSNLVNYNSYEALAAVGTPSDAIEKRRVMEQTSQSMSDVSVTKVTKLSSGVEYFDVKVGDGSVAEEGKTVQFQWVLRRSNGYFVDASSNYDNEPFIYKVGNTKKVIKGLDEAIRGMKQGGVRRISIPPSAAFVGGVGDDKPGPMPAGFGPRRQILTRIDREVWFFEIQLTKVRG